MKRFLPVLFGFIIFFSLLFPFASVYAEPVIPDGTWVTDPEVTFVGKNAARSAEFLRWTLQNYDWVEVAESGINPLVSFWVIIRNIVYAFSTLFVLVTAFVIIVTRGKNLTIIRFVPRFIGIILLVTFSFALVQFVYQITDVTQAFFLRVDPSKPCPPGCISSDDLLSVSFDYTSFAGLRKSGAAFDESAFTTLLLTKLTAITYYSMSGILLFRKIILWFFLILSPIFPFLLLHIPLRNTAKIWTGEFLRWVLYAPLFSVLLAGLVSLWRSANPVPLPFIFTAGSTYETSVNILLGGPGQAVSVLNSVNTPDTFALYVVALIMLWVVILLPFLLLQIFLSYLNKISIEEVSSHALFSRGTSLFGTPPPLAPAPYSFQGAAKALPMQNKFSVQVPNFRQQSGIINKSTVNNISQNLSQNLSGSIPRFSNKGVSNYSEILRLANLSLPTMRDVARYETKILSKDIREHEEVAAVRETLQKIANPASIRDASQRIRYTQIKEELGKQSNQGNSVATAILSAAVTVTSPDTEIARLQKVLTQALDPESIQDPIERKQFYDLKKQIVDESVHNEVASRILKLEKRPLTSEEASKLREPLKKEKEKGDKLATAILSLIEGQEDKALPFINKVQNVTIEDYEAVKKIWKENYEAMEVPHELGSSAATRNDWIQSDILKIDKIISDLVSLDKTKVAEGMKEVSSVLPFFLVGGFSQSEIIAYLKAKEEAGRDVLTGLNKNGASETMLDRKTENAQKPKEMEAEIPGVS